MTPRHRDNLILGLLALATALGLIVGCKTNWAFKPIAKPAIFHSKHSGT